MKNYKTYKLSIPHSFRWFLYFQLSRNRIRKHIIKKFLGIENILIKNDEEFLYHNQDDQNFDF